MKRIIKIFLIILAIILVSVSVAVVDFVISGGYWENMPFFSRYSGPTRFKQFVADPVPDYIVNLRGGYSGFPQGQITTYFTYEKPPGDWSFLTEWVESSHPSQERVTLLFGKEIAISRVFVHKDKEYYLGLDEQSKRALLYIP